MFTTFYHNNNKLNKFRKIITGKTKVMDIIIRPGHYQTKSSLGSDKPDIIRVLGIDKTKTDSWITQDGKSIPSYVLEQDYVALDTVPTLKNKTKPKKNLFADFSSVDVENQVVGNQQPVNQQPVNQPPANQQPVNQNPLDSKNPVITEILLNQGNTIFSQPNPYEAIKTIPFDISVIDKINIDKLNEKSMDKFGIEKYKKPEIVLEVPILLDYEISKLRTTIELLDLDEDVIVTYLAENISFDFTRAIKLKLKELLNQVDDEPKPEPKPEPVYVPTNPVIIEQSEKPVITKIGTDFVPTPGTEKITNPVNKPIEVNMKSVSLEKEITEISEYLNGFLSNKNNTK